MTGLLTIGEFAERCGLSRSALRFYDQNDLLRPRLVDEETGYRYYAIEQLDRAALVRQLRAAEMPVGDVRRYLSAPVDEQRHLLEIHLASFHERVDLVEAAVEALRRGLDSPGEAATCRIEAARFAAALAQVSFASAEAGARAELEVVWVETKDASLRLVATDSYRLAVRDVVPQQVGSHGLRGAISAQHVVQLLTDLDGAETLLLSQDQIGVVSATIDTTHRVVGDRGEGFPDYERILTELPAGDRIAVPRDRVGDALARLPTDVPHLKLSFEPGGLVLEARSIQATIPGRWPGALLCFYIDIRFFTEAVAAMVGPDLVIEALDPLKPITLRSADTGTFSVLTMPIRAPNPA